MLNFLRPRFGLGVHRLATRAGLDYAAAVAATNKDRIYPRGLWQWKSEAHAESSRRQLELSLRERLARSWPSAWNSGTPSPPTTRSTILRHSMTAHVHLVSTLPES